MANIDFFFFLQIVVLELQLSFKENILYFYVFRIIYMTTVFRYSVHKRVFLLNCGVQYCRVNIKCSCLEFNLKVINSTGGIYNSESYEYNVKRRQVTEKYMQYDYFNKVESK